jgi:hypothetical protein
MDEQRDDLMLVWNHPETHEEFLIGRLSSDGRSWTFCYEREGDRTTPDAIRSGFRLLEEFPLIERCYESPELFPTFRRRLLPAWQLRELATRYRTTPDALRADPLGQLRLTGGRMPTDGFEFREPAERRSSGEYRFRFAIVGWRRYQGESIVGQLRAGNRVKLRRDVSHSDAREVLWLLAEDDSVLGLVPVSVTRYLDYALDRGDYRATITEVGTLCDGDRNVTVEVVAEAPVGVNRRPFQLAPSVHTSDEPTVFRPRFAEGAPNPHEIVDWRETQRTIAGVEGEHESTKS